MRGAVLLVLALSSGCISHTVMTVPSPDGSAKAWIHESCGIPDCEVTVYLKSGWLGFAKTIARRSDCHINFAHIAWSADSRTVAVYSDHGWCQHIHEGYDVKRATTIPFAEVAGLVRKSIIREYQLTDADLLPYRGDALLWGSYAGDGNPGPGLSAFARRYRP